MLRSILAVAAGFALWTVLWLGSNGLTAAAAPDAFNPDGSTDAVGLLLLFLVLSVVFSVVSGYVTALVARRKEAQHALYLGLLLLAVGLFVQVQVWDLMPLWYHLLFLVLLVPAALVGGRLRARRPMPKAA